jgi:type VI protein secretion system component VasF
MRTPEDIQHEINRLGKELTEAREAAKGPWPRRITLYTRRSREAVEEDGHRLGLSPEACSHFKYCLDEVAVALEVQQDGTAKILGIAS